MDVLNWTSALLALLNCHQLVLNCTKDILNSHMSQHSLLIYTGEDPIVNMVTANLSRLSLQIRKSNFSEDYVSVKFVVLIAEALIDLSSFLDELSTLQVSSNKMKYFVVYLGGDDLEPFFRRACKMYMAKLVVIDSIGLAYTANLFGPDSVKSLGLCSNINAGLVYRSLENFAGHPIRVAVLIKPPFVISNNEGIEIACLQEASRRFNFTLSFYKEHFSILGFKIGPTNYTDLGKVVYENKSDLMMGLIRYNQTYYEDFDPSYPYLACSISTFVPAALKLQEWHGMLKVFTPCMWACIGTSILVMSLAFILLGSYKEEHGYSSYSYCTLTTLGLIVKHSRRKPKKLEFRLVFLSYVLFSCIVSSCFESTLVTFLIKPIYDHQISTVKEANHAGLSPQGNFITRQLFKDVFDNYIYNNWLNCYEPCFNSSSLQQRRFAVMVNNELIRYQIAEDLAEHERSMIYEIPGLLTYYTWMVMRKSFPLKGSLDKLLRRLREGGFITKWSKSYGYKKPPEKIHKRKKISVGSLVVPYFIYGFGVLTAVGVFAVEVGVRTIFLRVASSLYKKGSFTCRKRK